MILTVGKKNFKISPSDLPNKGIVFADLSKDNRGGHMGHAMVEYKKGEILAFHPNCNADNNGHSGRGWMEYRRSVDGGNTWTESKPFEYSKNMYDLNMGFTCMNEKAVLTDDGKIILFNLICDVSKNALWEPYVAPTYLISEDGGYTWSTAKRFTRYHGRVYDVYKKDGVIYALMACCYNSDPKDDAFRLYVSIDNGNTFFERSKLPFEPDRFYGSLEVLNDGKMIAYTYTDKNEYAIEYCVSDNDGRTFSEVRQTVFKNRLRNPQIIKYNGVFLAFGRSGNFGENPGNIVVYTSNDGITWGDATIIAKREAGLGAYSNVIKVNATESSEGRLLYMSSHAYKLNLTNTYMWWIDFIDDNK